MYFYQKNNEKSKYRAWTPRLTVFQLKIKILSMLQCVLILHDLACLFFWRSKATTFDFDKFITSAIIITALRNYANQKLAYYTKITRKFGNQIAACVKVLRKRDQNCRVIKRRIEDVAAQYTSSLIWTKNWRFPIWFRSGFSFEIIRNQVVSCHIFLQ